MSDRQTKTTQGFTLVEILVVSAMTVVVFMAVFSAIQYSLNLIVNSQARLSAMTLAEERIEYFRSLPYHDVGTVSGPVFGSIPNNNVLQLNGITFYEDVRVEFVLDPGDDVAGVDSNGILNDYKKVEVEIEWATHGASSSIVYTSNIVPVTVESNEGYGAVKVEVRDETTGLPLPGAEVRITNDTLSPSVDFTRTTGPTGVVLVAVPAGSGYHASTTMTDYSIDKTYEATGANPNPSPNSFLVEEALISDRPFRIGELSDMEISVYSNITDIEVREDFDDVTGLLSTSDVTVNGTTEALELTGTPGSYAGAGTTQLMAIVPAALNRWETAVVVGRVPAGTHYNVQFYGGDCAVSCVLINDTDLPGNSAGFSDRSIDLTMVDTTTYPSLTIQVNLSGDTVETPSIDDVALYYRSSETALAGTSLTVHGDKVIGTAPDIYKYQETVVTDSSGAVELSDVEFDQYTFDSTTLRPTRVCSDAIVNETTIDAYVNHQAGSDTELEMVLESTPAQTLRVVVMTDLGNPLPGARVELTRTGFSETVISDACGQAFIANTDGYEEDYVVTVSRAGYTSNIEDPFTIDGDTRLRVILNEQ